MHKTGCENKGFCNVIMSPQETKIVEFNQYQISDKAPFIIYADLECRIENTFNKGNCTYSIRFFNVYNIFI